MRFNLTLLLSAFLTAACLSSAHAAPAEPSLEADVAAIDALLLGAEKLLHSAGDVPFEAIEVLEAADKYAVGAVEMMQINLAEDPEGELDGWQFTVPVTNQASMAIPFMKLEMHFLDENGDTLQVDDYAVVAKDFGMPIEEERKVPIKPGETRDWIWTTGNVPAGWSRQVKVRPTAIRFDDGRPDGDE